MCLYIYIYYFFVEVKFEGEEAIDAKGMFQIVGPAS